MSEIVDSEVSPDQDQGEQLQQNEENDQAAVQMETTPQTSSPASATVVKSHAPQLPLARVKTIMKFDPDVSLAGGETVYLITKCTEMFIARLAETTYQYTVQGKRKTIQKRDIDQSILSRDYFSFLEGIFDRAVL